MTERPPMRKKPVEQIRVGRVGAIGCQAGMSGAGCWHNHQLPNKSVSLYHCAAVFGVATPNVGEATKRVGHRRKRQFVKNRKCCLTASYGFGNNPRFWFAEGFPSCQREQTVNLSALPSKVRILLPPPTTRMNSGFSVLRFGRAGVAQW